MLEVGSVALKGSLWTCKTACAVTCSVNGTWVPSSDSPPQRRGTAWTNPETSQHPSNFDPEISPFGQRRPEISRGSILKGNTSLRKIKICNNLDTHVESVYGKRSLVVCHGFTELDRVQVKVDVDQVT